jgi:hypothetical protein
MVFSASRPFGPDDHRPAAQTTEAARELIACEALFEKIHRLTDPAEVMSPSARHEVQFLRPDANP